MTDTSKTPKKRSWSWLLWWQVYQSELEEQVAKYETLSFFRSMRGVSVCCLLFSIAVTGAFAYFGVFDITALADAALFAVLALFIYLGHRWAMIAAMILWTFEKGIGVVSGFEGTRSPNVVMHVVWWCIYMHAFYFSFRIEQERKRRAASLAS
jgi:hypothetical protein